MYPGKIFPLNSLICLLIMYTANYTGKKWHFVLQEISRFHTGLFNYPSNVLYLRKFEVLLYISCYRIGHNFSDSFLDISSAVFVMCSVCKGNVMCKDLPVCNVSLSFCVSSTCHTITIFHEMPYYL